jgi:DNA-binding IclR family transcriptional regulator
MSFESDHGPAPALARGVEVLRLLDRNPDSTLEQIAAHLPYPKPSIFRILQTLSSCELVEKSPELRYRALQVFRPVRTSRVAFAQRLDEVMADLVAETGSTVEWFESTVEGMVLRRQLHPRKEVRVHARPGYVWPWNKELDSVAQIGFAFSAQAPKPGALEAYVKNGIMGPLSAQEIRDRIRRTLQRGTATDPAYNVNGIRRSAAAVFCPEWCGVLAIARAYHFGKGSVSPSSLEKRLREISEELRVIPN